ncbi:histidinol-phosphate transaminase [Vitiosangium sp. GDMCC 1.1324]|uniref:pyridoxal phosphate-dependent aminotransferase n=1 Tax=Vitiosangium sp. (strain GDMCC 1.1324) TaxID=2138576 RepID=UPI00130D82D2|nr:histidinol-phosphate transaminase [Vitiosangium sp. GDMCC 1.1324]
MSAFAPTRRALLTGAAVATAGLALRPALTVAAPAPSRPAPGTELIRLFSNENRYGPCEGAQRAMLEALRLSSRYASLDAVHALRRLIAEQEGVSPEHVLLTAGSLEALTSIAAEYGAGGGGVVCAEITFPALPNYAARLGAKVQRVPMDGHMAHDLEAMEARVGSGTKLVSVCNPNNPTGTVVDPARLRAFCEAVSSRATVLVDEVYLHYLEPAPGQSMVDLVRAGRNVIIVRSFSKIYGMAGMRVGYAIAQPDVVKRLSELKMALPNPISLAAAQASLQDTQFVGRMRKLNTEARKLTSKALDDVGMKHIAGHGNFLWIPLKPDQLDLPSRFIPHGFALTTIPKDPIPADVAALRLTIGTVEEMRAFATALRSVLKA